MGFTPGVLEWSLGAGSGAGSRAGSREWLPGVGWIQNWLQQIPVFEQVPERVVERVRGHVSKWAPGVRKRFLCL